MEKLVPQERITNISIATYYITLIPDQLIWSNGRIQQMPKWICCYANGFKPGGRTEPEIKLSLQLTGQQYEVTCSQSIVFDDLSH